MSFAFPLPDPDSAAVVDAMTVEGEATRAATTEVQEGIEGSLSEQQGTLIGVMQSIAGAIQGQIQAQIATLNALQQAITGSILQQLTSQRAALEVVLAQINTAVTTDLAVQSEKVRTVAIADMMRGGPGQPPPSTIPQGPPGQPPPGPWRPGTGPQQPPPTYPGNPPPQPTYPVGSSTLPQQPPPGQLQPWQPGTDTGTVPQQPPPPGMPYIPITIQPQTPGFDPLASVPSSPTLANVYSGGEGSSGGPEGSAPGGLPDQPPAITPQPGSLRVSGMGTVPMPPSEAQPPAQNEAAPPADTTQVQSQTQEGQTTVNVTVNLPAIDINVKEGDVSATATSSSTESVTLPVTINEDNRRQIEFAPEDDERQLQREGDGGRRLLRRLFEQVRPADQIPPEKPPPCPWQVGMAMPAIGSPDWCRMQRDIAQGMADAGNAVLDFVYKYVNGITELIYDMHAQIAANLTPFLGVGLSKGFEFLLREPRNAIGMLNALANCFRDVVKISPSCSPGMLLGVATFRMVIKSMSNVMIGTDAGMWLTGTLSLEIPQLERAVDYIMEALCPSMIPTAPEAWGAFAAGYITEQAWRCWTLMAGQDPDLWRPVREANGTILPADQVILWGRLMGEDDATIDTALYQRGWTRATDRAIVQAMYDRPRTGEQLAQDASRGFDDIAVLKSMQMDWEFGVWWTGPNGDLARAQGMTQERALDSWLNVKQQPPYQQLQQWYWRLNTARANANVTIDRAEVMASLRMGGAPATAMVAAAETLHRPLAPDEVALLVRARDAHPGEARDAMLDAGLEPFAAERVAAALAQDAERFRAQQEGTWTISAVLAAGSIGYKLPAPAAAQVAAQGLTPAVQAEARHVRAVTFRAQRLQEGRQRAVRDSISAAMHAYTTGIVTAPNAARQMTASGYDQRSATTILQARDLSLRSQRARKVIGALEKAVRRGEITGLAAAVVMAEMGFRQDAIDTYVTMWQMDLLASRPSARVAEIRRWIAQGLMTAQAGKLRLANLGWKEPDLSLQVAEARGRLVRAQQQASQKSARQLAQAAKEAERIKQQALRRLEKSRPVSALGQWYKDGVLTRDQVTRRMVAYGYDTNSIGLYLAGWDRQVEQRHKGNLERAGKTAKSAERQVPLGTVRQWYIQGILTKADADDRLRSYGYADAVRAQYIREWDGRKQATEERAAKGGKKQRASDASDGE